MGNVVERKGRAAENRVEESLPGGGIPHVTTGNFWTSMQRRSNPLHEVSYRACFKAELPRFFIERYTTRGDVVYDPFMGRGTTLLEAALNGRTPYGVDINPLSLEFLVPRLDPPGEDEVAQRLSEITIRTDLRADIDLSMFFHPDTEAEIMSLRCYLAEKRKRGTEDSCDRFIRMVATNRLTGHSSGFFSVYTLPPNQAASQKSQVRINRKLNQKPEYRDTKQIIARKASSLLKKVNGETRRTLQESASRGIIATHDARDTASLIPEGSVRLTVTSPPFLNIVQYLGDNWMRLWFNGIEFGGQKSSPFMTSSISEWRKFIGDTFSDLYRITSSGGRVAFEVGEIRKGRMLLEEHVSEIGREAGFKLESLIINSQEFSKTSNIWGVKNNRMGTNTNRIALFRKD